MILDLIRLPLASTMSLSRYSGRGMILMPGDSKSTIYMIIQIEI